MDLIFLRHGSSDQNALAAINELIENTGGTLRIAVAYFTHLGIAKALTKRADQGKSTLMLVNSSDLVRPVEGQLEYAVAQAILDVVNYDFGNRSEVRTLGLPQRDYHNMHHKFAVGDDRVLFGSANWTKAALRENYEYLAVSTEPHVIDQFEGEFAFLRSRSHSLRGGGADIRVIVCPHCKHSEFVDFESSGAMCTGCGTEFRPREAKI